MGTRQECLPQHPRQDKCQQHQIPVGQELLAHNLRHAAYALVAELIEHRCRGTFAGIGEIDAVAQVSPQCHAVAHHIYPAHHPVVARPLLPVQWQQHHHDDQRIGIEDGRGIKDQACGKQIQSMPPRHRAGIQTPVCEQEHQAAEHKQQVDNSQIAHQCHHWMIPYFIIHNIISASRISHEVLLKVQKYK